MRKTTNLILASALGAALLLGPPARADDGGAREQVQQLMPRLQSPDDAVRTRAENELFALGEDGRLELERISRDQDARKAVTALRLLQSDRWATAELRDGERPLQRLGERPDATLGERGAARLDDLEAEMERRFEAMRKQLDEVLRDVPRLRMPDLPSLGSKAQDGVSSVTTQGTVIRGERKLTWQRAADGKVRVTQQDGDGEEQVYEADDLDAFRAAYPKVASELDEVVPSWTGGPTLRVWEHLPDVQIPSGVWRWWHDDDDATEEPQMPAVTPARGPTLGIQWAPASALIRHHLRLDDTGVVVERVVPGTLAEKLGMQPMDVLVELAGATIRDRKDIVDALRAAGDAKVEAVVIRRGDRITLHS